MIFLVGPLERTVLKRIIIERAGTVIQLTVELTVVLRTNCWQWSQQFVLKMLTSFSHKKHIFSLYKILLLLILPHFSTYSHFKGRNYFFQLSIHCSGLCTIQQCNIWPSVFTNCLLEYFACCGIFVTEVLAIAEKLMRSMAKNENLCNVWLSPEKNHTHKWELNMA